MAVLINSAKVFNRPCCQAGIRMLGIEGNNEVSKCQVNAQNLAKLALRISSRMHSDKRVGESKKNRDLASIN